MKSSLHLPFFTLIALVVIGLTGAGCTHADVAYQKPTRRAIPLAPVSATSPGVGAPGSVSADTRATGTVARGEGDDPLDPQPLSTNVGGHGTGY